jgi:DNA-directed RNA polymerase subunit M/transcription elongation factor TFIIS
MLKLTQTCCPECGKLLHKGQHKFPDGMFNVFYCKECGYRKEIGE